MHCTAGGLQGCRCPWGVRSHLDTVQACHAKESSHKLLLPGTKDVSYSLPGKPCCGQSMCCCLRGLLNLRLLFAWGYPCARPALGAELQFRTFLPCPLSLPSDASQTARCFLITDHTFQARGILTLIWPLVSRRTDLRAFLSPFLIQIPCLCLKF